MVELSAEKEPHYAQLPMALQSLFGYDSRMSQYIRKGEIYECTRPTPGFQAVK